MKENIFWDVFRDTGEPMCWLMLRAADKPPAKKNEKKEREQKPSLS